MSLLSLVLILFSEGKTVEQCLEIKNTEIAQHLALPPVKLHCSMLAEDAIRAAVKVLFLHLLSFLAQLKERREEVESADLLLRTGKRRRPLRTERRSGPRTQRRRPLKLTLHTFDLPSTHLSPAHSSLSFVSLFDINPEFYYPEFYSFRPVCRLAS